MPQSATDTRSARRRSGSRQKHVPQRTCVVCRETSAKRALTRIVRVGDGVIEVDPTGRKNGRGAYLCDRRACWDRAASTPILARALKTTPTHESLTHLKEFAEGADLRDDTEEAPAVNSKE